MNHLAVALRRDGYSVDNRGYPSRHHDIAALADASISTVLAVPPAHQASRIHFVTHSMGGILVRSYLNRIRIPQLGRVVMLAPPNQGSEVVDRFGRWQTFGWVNGPAGQELGTGADCLPNRLGAVDYPVGVIAGDRSINWINSLILPGPDDGKVSVARTKVEGMSDHLVMHSTHPMIMRNKGVIAQTLYFLRHERFDHSCE
jgi:triacylglycerol lipase